MKNLDRSFNKSGNIWKKPTRVRGQIVRHVCESLEKVYGKQRLGNPQDPLDDLIYIILSNKTSQDISNRIYLLVKQKFATWDQVLNCNNSVLKSILKPAGLSNIKSQQIRKTLKQIKNDFGSCDLTQLGKRAECEIEEYLVSLSGVSKKVAKCVMMYTMNVATLPVDNHVHLIATRLGWTSRRRADQCHDELEALIPQKRRYTFHVDCILHGRTICRPTSPLCEKCYIRNQCEYFQHQSEVQ